MTQEKETNYADMSNKQLKELMDKINTVKTERVEKVNEVMKAFFNKVKASFSSEIASQGAHFLETFGEDRKSLTIGNAEVNGVKVTLQITLEKVTKKK